MSQLQIFNYERSQIRVIERHGELWWVLKDVCDALALSNPTIVAQRLDTDEQVKVDPKAALGSHSNTPITLINEPGLYNVILRSDKPEAKKFKRWVTHEVLPTLRKTGAYSQSLPDLSDEALQLKMLLRLSAEQQDIQSALTDYAKRIAKLEQETLEERIIARPLPPSCIADPVMQFPVTISEIAALYGIGGATLNKILHSFRLIYRGNSGHWKLYADYANRGYTGASVGLRVAWSWCGKS